MSAAEKLAPPVPPKRLRAGGNSALRHRVRAALACLGARMPQTFDLVADRAGRVRVMAGRGHRVADLDRALRDGGFVVETFTGWVEAWQPTPVAEKGPAAARAPRRPPGTRAECAGLPRPCPATRCRHHTGSADTSCSLDVADQGGATIDEVAAALGVSHGLIDYIETRALTKLRSRIGIDARDLFDGFDFGGGE